MILNETRYSQLLQLEALPEEVTLCRILDPWNTGRVMMQYLLVPKANGHWDAQQEQQMTQQYGESVVLRTPLQRMALTSSCHAWLLGQLSALDRVNVMCDTAYVTAQTVKEWMRSSEVLDGGTSSSPNAEVMLAAESDALWISPYENCNLGNLTRLPIPIIYCAEYMETTPLGRAEWMRFYGRLVDRAAAADSLFAHVVTQYEATAARIDSTCQQGQRPTLLVELPYGATWYVPGGQSTAALLYHDAGFDYLWQNDEHAGSLSLSKEAVLAKASQCDLWLIKYNDPASDWTLAQFGQQDPIYAQFRAFQTGNVWGCNTSNSDFFDVTPFRPDSLLASLAAQDGAFFKLIIDN